MDYVRAYVHATEHASLLVPRRLHFYSGRYGGRFFYKLGDSTTAGRRAI